MKSIMLAIRLLATSCLRLRSGEESSNAQKITPLQTHSIARSLFYAIIIVIETRYSQSIYYTEGANIMKKSSELDKQCIEKILKNINRIKSAFEHFNINSLADFQNCDLAQLAITQAITNIHESKKHMQDDTLVKLQEFDTIRLSGTRNIASHDYDSLNEKVVYEICLKLLAKQVNEVLSNEYGNL